MSAQESYALLEALTCTRSGCACTRSAKRGTGLTHCPAHDDDHPSLNVSWSNGRLLWHCKTGCSQETVLAALRERGLLHEIRDRDGSLLARHERKGRWLRPDGQVGLNGSKSADLLYGLEQLQDAEPNGTAVLVEGEKAADALRGLDVLALGTVCGASVIPSPEVLGHLVGRDVVLWPDADEPGSKHMEGAAAALRDLGIEPRFVHWPDAPEHGDAADFVAQHPDREEVLALLQAAQPLERAVQDVPPSSPDWRRQNLDPILRGEVPEVVPEYLTVAGGYKLLYPGLCHWISGEPEGLKSWLAQIAVAEVLMEGDCALYIDFESDAGAIVNRLLALGVARDRIAAGLVYIRPETPLSSEAQAALVAEAMRSKPTVSVIDGVNAGMALCGYDPIGWKDFANWWTQLGRPVQLQTSGPTVAIDHVVKNPEQRGSYMYGSMGKQAAIDAAHLGVIVLDKFGRGLTGRAKIVVHKDRPGFLNGRADGGRVIAYLTLASDADTGAVTWQLEAAGGEGGYQPKPFRPTYLMERISRYVEMADKPPSQNRITDDVTGKKLALIKAIQVLADERYVVKEPAAKGFTYRSQTPYREVEDPLKTDTGSTGSPPVPTGSQEPVISTGSTGSPVLLNTGNREPVDRGSGTGRSDSPVPGPSRCPSCDGALVRMAQSLWCTQCSSKWPLGST